MSAPLVSVIIPCYNAERWITETLQSVQAQEGINLEVIVVDDGSTDGSATLVEQSFPTVRLLRTPNGGPGRARNRGIAAARGSYFQFLDADDLLAPGKLARQLTALSESGADVAYGNWERAITHADGRLVPTDRVSRQIEGAPEIALFTSFWCPPAVYLFRRTIVERVGGWPDHLMVGEDARFVLDCALHGARFVYCAAPMARYRVHTSGSASSRDRFVFNRDVYRNAMEIEAWWRAHGGLTAEREVALVRVLEHVAQASYESHRPLFEEALAELERLRPDYRPRQPHTLALLSRVVGYRRAEALSLYLRRGKNRLRPLRDKLRALHRAPEAP